MNIQFWKLVDLLYLPTINQLKVSDRALKKKKNIFKFFVVFYSLYTYKQFMFYNKKFHNTKKFPVVSKISVEVWCK